MVFLIHTEVNRIRESPLVVFVRVNLNKIPPSVNGISKVVALKSAS